MDENEIKLLRIQNLHVEREMLKQDILSAAVMDDEGMNENENILHTMEIKLAQINLELERYHS